MEAEPAQCYGLAEDRHSVLGCEARWFTLDHTRVTPQEAQDGGAKEGPPPKVNFVVQHLDPNHYSRLTNQYSSVLKYL